MNRFSLAEITARHDELILIEREVVVRCEAFVEMMSRHPTFSRLVEQCGVYISRLGGDDQTDVLAIALELAWEFSEDFDPEKRTVVSCWDSCLRYAMATRSHWECRFRQGRLMVATEDIPKLNAEV